MAPGISIKTGTGYVEPVFIEKPEGEHNRSRRVFRFRDYRNVGVGEDETLVVNRSSKEGERGDLVIIVGPNNSGKSNIIDGIVACANSNYDAKDRPEWPIGQDFHTRVTMEVSGTEANTSQSLKISNIPMPDYASKYGLSTVDVKKAVCVYLKVPDYDIVRVSRELIASRLNNCGKVGLVDNMIRYSQNILRDILNDYPETDMFVITAQGSDTDCNPDVLIRIIRYASNKSFTQKDLMCGPNDLNELVENVLSTVGVEKRIIDNYYENYRFMGTPMVLRQEEREINSRLSALSDRFNAMYFSENAKYSFEIVLLPDSISLNIMKGNKILKLDNQSTGFKWFFDLFFGMLAGDTLSPGDIVLMDEPATNLHVSGQMELRRFLKDFARRNQVTFVICTHSPFLIDCDHLDEVRVVTRDANGLCHIENNFLTVDADDPNRDSDKLEPMLSALTVGRHIVLDPSSRVVFVEGITDYNYLTAFKELLGIKGITFLPIGGLKKRGLGEKLRRICADPIILVDSDVAGYIAKKDHKAGRVDVIALSDVNPSFVGDITEENFRSTAPNAKGFTIEDLFSQDDLENIVGSSKEIDRSSVIKTYIDVYGERFSEETKSNFRKVFDYLAQEFMDD